MRILYFTAEPPWPLDQGDKLRNYYLLRALAEKHDVFLVTFCSPGDYNGSWREKMKPLCREIYTVPLLRSTMVLNLLKNPLQPFTMAARKSSVMAELVRKLSTENRYDLVFTCQLKMAGYLPFCTVGKKVAELTDFLSIYRRRMCRFCKSLPSRILSNIEATRLAYWEKKTAKLADLTILVSRTDADELRRLAPYAHVAVLPNGVDMNYFKPTFYTVTKERNKAPFGEATAPDLAPHIKQDRPLLLFYGHLRYPPNLDGITWFIKKIFPHVRSVIPDAELMILGKEAPRDLVKISEQSGVSLVGLVPDIRPYLVRADVVIAPLRFGAGVRNKILEAMAMGKAVVSTTLGCEGLEVVPGVHLEVADKPSDFAGAVIELLQKPEKRTRIGYNGRGLIKEKYDWKIIGERLRSDVENIFANERQ